jgi:hypothetical protein
MYDNKLASSTKRQYYTAMLQTKSDDLPRSKFFLIIGVGLWVLRPLTGLLYQPRVIVKMIVEKLVE